MDKNAKILVTGGQGMAGGAVLRQLRKSGYQNLLAPTHQQLDLTLQTAVQKYFIDTRPDYVFHLAAIVGGIHANNIYPGKFIYENTQMQCHVIHEAYQCGVKKLLFPGSACTYPKLAPQPITENSFLEGAIEPTNLAYASAKINGIVMCQAYAKQYGFNAIVPMPTNAYGVGDHFDVQVSHVIPALMMRFHEAKDKNLREVVLWGTGNALREFIYVDDFANALIFLMEQYDSSELVNIGTMQEISIRELAKKIARVVDYHGEIVFDTQKPDGAPRKCLDSGKLFALGWQPRVNLLEGLQKMYQFHFLTNNLSQV